MVRGPKKHLKRLAAPKSWMLDKLGGVYTTRCSSGPHKLHESMPMQLFLRNRLKYALTAKECRLIMKQRLVKVRILFLSKAYFGQVFAIATSI
jgi:small subunit ribosomal protein S4e